MLNQSIEPKQSGVLTGWSYLLLVVYYVVIVFIISFLGGRLIYDAITNGDIKWILIGVPLVIIAPYFGCVYIHKWTKTRTKKVSKIIVIAALSVWAIFAINYNQENGEPSYMTYVNLATWASIMFYHYKVLK